MRPSQVSESEVFRTETCENRKNTAHVSNMSPVFPEGSDLLFSTEVSDSSTQVYVCRLKALQCVYFFLCIIFFLVVKLHNFPSKPEELLKITYRLATEKKTVLYAERKQS